MIFKAGNVLEREVYGHTNNNALRILEINNQI